MKYVVTPLLEDNALTKLGWTCTGFTRVNKSGTEQALCYEFKIDEYQTRDIVVYFKDGNIDVIHLDVSDNYIMRYLTVLELNALNDLINKII